MFVPMSGDSANEAGAFESRFQPGLLTFRKCELQIANDVARDQIHFEIQLLTDAKRA
jgi:hypothetical protein